jgi:S-adenosylmethionine:tRNA ribosyltransferase-isomerase
MKNENPETSLSKEFYFDLPDHLIARFPPDRRDESRMLHIDLKTGSFTDSGIVNITDYLRPGDLLVRNATKVSFRSVPMIRETGPEGETKQPSPVLFLTELTNGDWVVLLRGRKKLNKGHILKPVTPYNNLQFTFIGKSEEIAPDEATDIPASVLRPSFSIVPEDFFSKSGNAPIPPYFARESQEIDKERYRTIYQKESPLEKTSVAAPTAGFHFTPEIMEKIAQIGASWLDIELHIGYGTFAPLKEENIRKKELHKETYLIGRDEADVLNSQLEKVKAGHGRIIAVGTTALRALEDNFRKHHSTFRSGAYETSLFLYPPDSIQSTQGLLTNFHLPGSSLIMLVACLTGRDLILEAYRHAVEQEYRFFSYGDCSLIT